MFMEKILEVVNLNKFFGTKENQTRALNGISFTVYEGEFVGIMGASGSGKTTLLNCISTVLKATSGNIFLRGTDITGIRGKSLSDYRGKEIGFMFQDYNLLETLTGLENIALPLSIHGVPWNDAKEQIKRIAEKLGIHHILQKYPGQMSGGEQQRVTAARALLSDPSIILADEPTGSLDSKSAKTLMELMGQIREEEGKTLLMVTHDPTAASYCSRIIFIKDGQLFHELLKESTEKREGFYDRILQIMAYMGGGTEHVL